MTPQEKYIPSGGDTSEDGVPAFVQRSIGEDAKDGGENLVVSKRKRSVPIKKKRLTKNGSTKAKRVKEADILVPDRGVETRRIEEGLTEIYENKDGSMPDMRTFEKRSRRRVVRALVVLTLSCFFLTAVVWVGFFVLIPGSSFSQEDVVVSIAGDEQVLVGADTHYRIRYRNAQNVGLQNVLVQVRYPAGFIFRESSQPPVNETKDEWVLGDLAPDESGFIDIFGQMYADFGEAQSFRVFLNYTPTNFQSEFQKVTSLNVTVSASPVVLSVAAPTEAVADAEVEIPMTLRREVPNGYSGAIAIEVASDSFLFSTSDPKPTRLESPYQWVVPSGQEEYTIRVRGRFRGGENNQATFAVKAVGWRTSEPKGEAYVLATSSHPVSLLQSNILGQLVINGSSGDMAVEPGELLNTTIAVKNVGQSTLRDATVRLVFDAPSSQQKSILDWRKLTDAKDGTVVGEQLSADRRRGSVTWDKKTIPALRQLQPGQEVTIDVQLPLKNTGEEDLTLFPSGAITALAEVQYSIDGERSILATKPITLTIQSDLTLSVEDDVSTRDGKDLHTMTWALNNTFHDLADITVEAEVYGDVAWAEDVLQVPAGQVHWEREAKKIVWKVDQMPRALDVLALRFGILLNQKNPTQTNLTSKVRLKAKDTITGQEILKVGDEILLNSGN